MTSGTPDQADKALDPRVLQAALDDIELKGVTELVAERGNQDL